MKIKTSTLADTALDHAVAVAAEAHSCEYGYWDADYSGYKDSPVSYSTDWMHGGPIIERECITVECAWPGNPEKKTWSAAIGLTHRCSGHTPLLAAMRCYVASKMGDEVEIPEELEA